MDLKTALKIREISKFEGSEMCGVTVQHFTQVLERRTPAGRVLALQICKIWPEVDLISLLIDHNSK